jgi:hypothetical protein
MAIAFASFSGGSEYACREFAVDGAPVATGAGDDSVAPLCAASIRGVNPASNAAEQTISCANRLNIKPTLPLPPNSARIDQESKKN